MKDNNIQNQIDRLEQKVDLVLSYVNDQRLKSTAMDDLMNDISIIGKDVYDSTVKELDNQMVEINPDEIRMLFIKLLKNTPNLISIVDAMASINDLIRDASPLVNELIIDFTKKLHELESKGYFSFLNEMIRLLDNIITHFSQEDIRQLADNVAGILETIKNLTQPDMMASVNNAVKVFRSMDSENIPSYSIWKLMRELNKPEMKKSMGLMVTFMKKMSA